MYDILISIGIGLLSLAIIALIYVWIQPRVVRYIVNGKRELKKEHAGYLEMFKSLNKSYLEMADDSPLGFIFLLTAYPIMLIKFGILYLMFFLPMLSIRRLWLSTLEVIFAANEEDRENAVKDLALRGALTLIGGELIASELSELTDPVSSLESVDQLSDNFNVNMEDPIDDTFGRPSEVDGEPRVDHYVEPYTKSDGTVVRGHWKSHRG